MSVSAVVVTWYKWYHPAKTWTERKRRDKRARSINELSNDHIFCLPSSSSLLIFDLSLPVFLSMFNDNSLKMQSFHWRARAVTRTHAHTHSHEHTDPLRAEPQLILLNLWKHTDDVWKATKLLPSGICVCVCVDQKEGEIRNWRCWQGEIGAVWPRGVFVRVFPGQMSGQCTDLCCSHVSLSL